MITILETPNPSNKTLTSKAIPVYLAKAKTVDPKTPEDFAKVLRWAKQSTNRLIILGYCKHHQTPNDTYTIVTKAKENLPTHVARTQDNFILSDWKLIDIDDDNQSFNKIEALLHIEDTPRVRAYSSRYYLQSIKRKHIYAYLSNITSACQIANNYLIDQSVISAERIVYAGKTIPSINPVYIEPIESIFDEPYQPVKNPPLRKVSNYKRPTVKLSQFDLKQIMTHLATILADDYPIWRNVGAILESLEVENDDTMFNVFNEWSRKSAKYDYDAVVSEWDKFKHYVSDKRLSIGSLSWMALSCQLGVLES